MSSRLSQKTNFLLFLILLVLPFQLGKHFWPSWSYISGIRVDYLSPTVYVSDVLILFLFLFAFFAFLCHCERPKGARQSLSRLLRCFTPRNDAWVLIVLGVIAYLSFGIFFSVSPMAGWYFLLKLLELAFFGWYIATQSKNIMPLIFWAFSLDVFLEGILAVLQFVHQSAIGGVWYFLGERTFSATTPGIANASIHGQLVLRPYATFSHPNVLAGYMVITLLFFLTHIFTTKIAWQKIASVVLVCFGFGILLLTLSRVAIIVFVLVSFLFLLLRLPKKRIVVFSVACCLVASALFTSSLLSGRFFDVAGYMESLRLRDILMQAAWQMFVSHPLLGVGLGNFLPSLPSYISSRLLFAFLQPVHNIFLLVLAETGIVGFGIFVAVLVFAFAESFKKLKEIRSLYSSSEHRESRSKKPHPSNLLLRGEGDQGKVLVWFSFLALLAICLVGATDHYFLTLQQGQLLFALVIGLSCSKSYK